MFVSGGTPPARISPISSCTKVLGATLLMAWASFQRLDRRRQDGSGRLAFTGRVGRHPEALLDGEPFRLLEVNEIGCDEELPPQTFVLELPAGQVSAPPEYRDVPLDRLSSEVAFTVFVPEHPPVAADPMEPVEPPRTATIMPAAPRWNVPLHVHVTYQLGPGRMLTLRESAEPMPVREDQELTPRGDLLVAEDRTTSPPRTNVRLRRSRTHVELEALGMSLEELVALAATLVPLSTP
jgi:hypothetical protein